MAGTLLNFFSTILLFFKGTDVMRNEFVYHAAFKTITGAFHEALCGGIIRE